MSDVDVIPGSTEISTIETRTLPLDAGPMLAGGQSVTSPASTLTDRRTGLPVTLADTPAVSGTQVLQPVRGSALEKDHTYDLWVEFTADALSPASKLAMHLTIVCPGP